MLRGAAGALRPQNARSKGKRRDPCTEAEVAYQDSAQKAGTHAAIMAMDSATDETVQHTRLSGCSTGATHTPLGASK